MDSTFMVLKLWRL